MRREEEIERWLLMTKIQKNIMSIVAVIFLIVGIGNAETISPMQPSKEDKCPVCGMFVYKYPDWTAHIIFKDGAAVFFDGCKDLFKYYLDLKKYSPGRKIEDIAGVYVNEYYEMKTINAVNAYFVVGSDVYGPMGYELIPLASIEDAETFRNDHKGKEILRFREVTQEVIDGLD